MKKEALMKEKAMKKGSLVSGIQDFFKIIWRNKMSRVGLLIVAVFILIAIFGPIFVEEPESDFLVRLKAPSSVCLLWEPGPCLW